ncbi:MAG: ATP-binding protein [Jaaginema sp. PMC 1079.18]|nr:ATP-binding protein [Jaaginema sp. PMC 1079.18]
MDNINAVQNLILNRVDNAIALFDGGDRLILFNQKLSQVWGLAADWLEQEPHFDDIAARCVARSYWTPIQAQQFRDSLHQQQLHDSFCLAQHNGIYIEVEVTCTDNGSTLFNIRDLTNYQQSEASLKREVQRLSFLLGLTEHLQPATDLREIGQFALSYLVETMGAAFGDVKVISGKGEHRSAGTITNNISSEFIATYGVPAIEKMEKVLQQGIPYGQGLLWQVVESGEPLFVNDYQNHPNAIAGFRHPGIQQLGIFPIPSAGGSIIGVLTLESRVDRRLEEVIQPDMLLAACRTLGVAIERAQAQEELRQANDYLERASQMKSEFLASMSHELRTPLNSILGFSDLLARQIGGNLTARQLNYVSAIDKGGQHLLALINDILDLSKIEAGKIELELESVSIQDLCRECLKMIQPRAQKKRIALSLELDYQVDRVILDERRSRQMLINLLTNAVKFSAEGNKVKLIGRLAYGSELAAEKRPDRSPVNESTPYVCLEVVDRGIGIPEAKQHLLFRPFQQIDSSLTRQHEGTGLGLALTKRLAELHGGTVSLESVEHQGSTFRIWLPLTELRNNLEDAAPSTSERPAQILRQRSPRSVIQRILVVEDQPFNQALVSEFLEIEGYEVEIIYEGQTMVDLLRSPLANPQNLPDLLLIDIQLPEVDGFTILRQLRQNETWRHLPAIAVTAMAMPGDRERCLAAGADDYISKPINLEELLIKIRAFLT